MSGHTKGRVEADGNGVHLLNGQCVALTHMEPKERRDADAALIAEAFNAPEDAGILAFSAELQGIPPARLERATCRLEGGCSILQFPTENVNSEVGLPPAWTHSDPRLASLVAAWRAADGPTRAAFLSQVMRKEAA